MSTSLSLRRLRSSFIDLIFPLRCLGCGKEGDLLCPDCRLALPRIKQPYCQRCGAPLAAGYLCSACINYPMAIDGIRSVFRFEGTIRQAIHQFKYRHIKAMAGTLGQLLAEHLRNYPLAGDVLMPVPLHPKRLRERGYNQAALLAKEISRIAGMSVIDGLLVRQRDTVTQARAANAWERRANVKDAFGCRQELNGRNVLLIDDVCTTGATLDACASALKTAGAGTVWGLTAAREVSYINQ